MQHNMLCTMNSCTHSIAQRVSLLSSYYYVLVESFSTFPALETYALGGLFGVDER